MSHFPTPRPGTKREIAMRVFRRELPKRKQMIESIWRKNTLQKIAQEADTTHYAAVSMYNYEKCRAVHEGITEDFGRSASASKQEDDDVTRLKIQLLRSQARLVKGPYLLKNQVTKEIVGYFASRKEAISVQLKDEVIVEA